MPESPWVAIGNAFAPFDPVPPSRLDTWYVERPQAIVERLVRILSPERLPGRHILVGQPASGKSTELTKLAAELERRHGAFVVRFDMTDNTDVERANPVEVIFLMGAAIYKAGMAELPPEDPPDVRLLETLKRGLETLVRRHTDNKEFTVNVDKLLAGLIVFVGAALAGPVGAGAGFLLSAGAIRAGQAVAEKFMPFRFTSGTNSEVVRRLEVEPSVEAMIESLNAIIDDIRLRTAKPLILIVDGLDKLRDRDVISLNFLEKKFLNGPRCSVLYTGPLDLYYSPDFGEVRARFPVVAFPHVKLHERHDSDRADSAGWETMRQVVHRRLRSLGLEPSRVLTDEALDQIIKGSGGVMRDLVRLVQAAALEVEIGGGSRIEPREAARALNELRRALMAQLTPEYHEILDRVRATHQRVSGEGVGDKCDQLLRNDVVLSYINDDIWFDAHAALTPDAW